MQENCGLRIWDAEQNQWANAPRSPIASDGATGLAIAERSDCWELGGVKLSFMERHARRSRANMPPRRLAV